MKKIAIIGAGNLGGALAEGLCKSTNFKPTDLILTRNQVDKIAHFANKGVQILRDNVEAVRQADVVILAVKPYKVVEILEQIRGDLRPESVLVSVASGFPIVRIQEILKKEQKIIRAMPNTGASVAESMTCICGNSNEGMKKTRAIFSCIGKTELISEELMNAATVLGACGIAYVLRFIRAMVQGGIEIGFDAKTASTIVNYTVLGAAQLLIQNGRHPEEEIDHVTTPKGCTIVGLNEMEHQGFSAALIKGIKTSFENI